MSEAAARAEQFTGPETEPVQPGAAELAAMGGVRRVARSRHGNSGTGFGDRGPDILAMYLEEIGQIPLLTREDEALLGRQVMEGQQALRELEENQETLTSLQRHRLQRTIDEAKKAQTTFVQANLRLVVSVAKGYRGMGLELEDLVSEGNFGLIHAVEKFDYRKGFKFSTYATKWIQQAIQRGIQDKSRTIRVPGYARGYASDWLNAAARLTERGVANPTGEQIREEAGFNNVIAATANLALHNLNRDLVSLDAPAGPDGDAEMQDFIPAKDTLSDVGGEVEASFQAGLMSILDKFKNLGLLDERERRVLESRYGEERKSFKVIAAEMSLSTDALRRIEKRFLGRARVYMEQYGVSGEDLEFTDSLPKPRGRIAAPMTRRRQ